MRSLGQGIKHLLLAVIWLAALACITEVALRAQRWHARAYPQAAQSLSDPADDVVPSAETYQQLRPMLGIIEDPDRQSLRTNAFGLRGPEMLIPKPAGVFRVICLGDDTTLARQLHEEETYCERLRVHLQQRTQLRVEVINAGLPGGCPLTGLLLLRHRLLGLQPDVVLQHVDPTDIEDDRLVRPFTFMDEQGLPLAAVHPSCRQTTSPTLLSLSHEFLVLDWLRDRCVDEWQATAAQERDPWDEVDWEMAATQAFSPLADLRTLVTGVYCTVIVTTADDPLSRPSGAVARRDGIRPASDETGGPPSDLGGYVRALQLPYLDATAELRAQDPRQPPLRVETPDEHDLYAELQAECIVANVPGVWTPSTSGAPGVLPGISSPQPLTDAAPLRSQRP
ncbi:MAG: hypothetical protein JNG89_04140 [Planctomycetaceae bacterium]|nr:hypothetical protein [Planctomycetaceae bacterium]